MKIVVAGDFCPRLRGADAILPQNLSNTFDEIKHVVETADYSVINVECPIYYKGSAPIQKIGPNLRADESMVDAVEYLGFNCVTLANNHILDYGSASLLYTKKLFEARGIDTVGVGNNTEEASKYISKEICGNKVAIINCCEEEYSIASRNSAGANHLDPINQYYEIQEAKKDADKVIVIVHGGHENWQLPSERMVKTYRFFIDAGADCVINHHQHCYSGYEYYKGRPIFYGLGNFFFDIHPQRTHMPWNYGYMVILEFSDDNNVTHRVVPYEQCAEQSKIHVLESDALSTDLERLNSIIRDPKSLESYNNKYYEDTSIESALVVEPFQGRIIQGLQYRHLLPLLRSKKSLIKLYDFLMCESHYDRLKYYLRKKIENDKL